MVVHLIFLALGFLAGVAAIGILDLVREERRGREQAAEDQSAHDDSGETEVPGANGRTGLSAISREADLVAVGDDGRLDVRGRRCRA